MYLVSCIRTLLPHFPSLIAKRRLIKLPCRVCVVCPAHHLNVGTVDRFFHSIMITIIKGKGKFAPEQAMKTQRGSKCVALFFL
jgi:hypothetical protein